MSAGVHSDEPEEGARPDYETMRARANRALENPRQGNPSASDVLVLLTLLEAASDELRLARERGDGMESNIAGARVALAPFATWLDEPLLVTVGAVLAEVAALRVRADKAEYDLAETQSDLAQYRKMWDEFAKDHVPASTHRSTVEAYEAECERLRVRADTDKRKIAAYDAARATVKIEGNTRAYYVLRAENAEAEAERLRVRAEGAEQKLAKAASIMGVCDGGRYINDWISRSDSLRVRERELTEALDLVDAPYPLEVFPERTDEQRDAIFAAMRAVDKYATEWFYAHVARDRGRVARAALQDGGREAASRASRAQDGARKQLAWMEEMERIEQEVFPDSRPRSEVIVETEGDNTDG